jgi:PAS domain S-box-containing protein
MRSRRSRPSSPALLSASMRAARLGVFHFDIEKNRLTYSDELLALLGIDKSQFGGTREAADAIHHPDDIARGREALASSDRLDLDFRIIRPDGEVRWMHCRGNIVRDPDGTPIEAYGVKLDITERKRAEEHQALLLAELNHRMRNILARMNLIVERSRSSAESVDALAAAISGRLGALARAQARFNRRNPNAFRLSELVEDEVAPYRSETNVSVEGPGLPLLPEPAQGLAMVLHELVTNAVKYGALSTAGGCVSVRWEVAGEMSAPQLTFVWQEAGGPTVIAPTRQGFGTRLIDTVVRHELGGRVELSLPPTGARCAIEVPLERVAGKVD